MPRMCFGLIAVCLITSLGTARSGSPAEVAPNALSWLRYVVDGNKARVFLRVTNQTDERWVGRKVECQLRAAGGSVATEYGSEAIITMEAGETRDINIVVPIEPGFWAGGFLPKAAVCSLWMRVEQLTSP